MQGAEGTGAGRIHHAVGAAQVVLLADPPCHHVTQQAGEGVFLPAHVGIGNPLYHILCHIRRHSGILQGLAPAGMTQAGAQRNHHLQRTGYPQDHADLAAVKLLVRTISGILQRLSGSNQTQQLRGVNCFKGVWRNVVFHRVKRHFRQETAPFAVGLVRGLGIGIIEIIHTPV